MLTLVVAHTELKCVVGRANEAFRTNINDVCPYPTRKMLWDPFMDGEVQFVTVYGPEYVPWMAVAGIVTGVVCGSLLWCLIKKVLLKPQKRRPLPEGDAQFAFQQANQFTYESTRPRAPIELQEIEVRHSDNEY